MNDNKNTSDRWVNIEILRIIAMLFIIIHHLIYNGLNWSVTQSTIDNTNILFYCIGGSIESFVIVGVNIFFLISGYFGMRFKVKKCLSIVFKLYIYMLIIEIVGVLTNIFDFDISMLKRFVTAFHSYWFIEVYIILMIISPLINILIDKIDKKNAAYFWYTFIFVFCGYAFVVNSSYIGIARGYSLGFAICLYILGRLIRKGLLFKTNIKYLMYYFLFGGLNALFIIISILLLKKNNFALLMLSYNNPLVVIESILLFNFFIKKRQNNINSKFDNMIRFFGKKTLSIYILHSTNKVLTLYRNIPLQVLITTGNWIIAIFILIPYALIIFVVGGLIDEIYEKTIGKLIELILDKMNQYMVKCNLKIDE